MSIRDSQARGGGKSPPFHMRINPELKEQFEQEAQTEGVSLANWMKELGREALRKKGIEPKG
ncbi:toxin-antitoxin system HicB family antitoxin [Pluralibacter gergoviae]|uniref:toxin-antitoxin system HicB family antitoxin n=1 Tax=Pluralibacter gergoviae TaxID=61647 RepID=UPI00190943D7|nr:toxin-antitoxin system HicB family antitoxin [Pluralibacter gergoviae]ELC3076229.1 toxin-antitoxin system HicB family antitoxin [Pluralibacter gergoviae]MBK4116285.1 toxin-antitoxin system HicB family antitoxin [Pluralibacter gergoviae]